MIDREHEVELTSGCETGVQDKVGMIIPLAFISIKC